MVHKCLGQLFDREALAADIWLEVWQKEVETSHPIHVSWSHVRRRCVDEIRRVSARREVDLREFIESPKQDESEGIHPLNLKLLVDKLMSCPILRRVDMDLIYKKLYCGNSNAELALEFQMSPTAIKRWFSQVINTLRVWSQTVTDVRALYEEIINERE